jgi:hypothetical protein
MEQCLGKSWDGLVRDQKQPTRPKLVGVEHLSICRPCASFSASIFFIRLHGYQDVNPTADCKKSRRMTDFDIALLFSFTDVVNVTTFVIESDKRQICKNE